MTGPLKPLHSINLQPVAPLPLGPEEKYASTPTAVLVAKGFIIRKAVRFVRSFPFRRVLVYVLSGRRKENREKKVKTNKIR